MGVMTTVDIPSGRSEYYDRVLLTRAIPALVHDIGAQKRPIPPKSSKVVKFRRYLGLEPATVPLEEGQTPTESTFAYTDITATTKQYGAFVRISDLVDLTNPDPIITEAAEILGEQAGATLDVLNRDVIVSGTNVLYNNGASRSAVNTALTAATLNRAIRTLENALAKKFTRVITAGTGVSTSPIGAAYLGIVHPYVAYDLRNISGFVPVENYAAQGPVMAEEIGAYRGIRFLQTTLAKYWSDAGGAAGSMKSTTGTNADVFAVMIFGTNAYGSTEVRGKGIETITKPLGSGEDPLNQRLSHGWKVSGFAAKILNEAFMIRVETAATA